MHAWENQKVPKRLFSNFLLPVFFYKIEFLKFETRFVCEAYDLKLLLIVFYFGPQLATKKGIV